MANIAVILSGGVGTRMGLDVPKQYVEVCGKTVLSYSVSTLYKSNRIDKVVIVVADEWLDFVKKSLADEIHSKPTFFAKPGETRQYSIYNALNVIKGLQVGDNDVVIIHDGARPLLSEELVNRCLETIVEAEAVLPVIPVKDTTYLSTDGKNITSLLDRGHLWNGQSPEAFVFGRYLESHQTMSREELLKINGSTELAFKTGLKCVLVTGDPFNFKITTPEDLSNFESIIKR